MSEVFVHGLGAVTPAGWGLEALSKAMRRGEPIPVKEQARPGRDSSHQVRRVPKARDAQLFMTHPRMRRTSPITRFAVGAALEALGEDLTLIKEGKLRLGIVACVMSGCVNYSRRFYDETLRDPMTASPLVFPETVFNAPSSHLAALLGAGEINYTLVGDPGIFLQGVGLAANWLSTEPIDGCLVVGAEELDWLTADAFRLFTRQMVLAEGGGAIYLKKDKPSSVSLSQVTKPHLFDSAASRQTAAGSVRQCLPEGNASDLLVESRQGIDRFDRPESDAWSSWTGKRIAPKETLGEGLMAAAAWQTVIAADAVRSGTHPSSMVNVVGCNQQVTAGMFTHFQ